MIDWIRRNLVMVLVCTLLAMQCLTWIAVERSIRALERTERAVAKYSCGLGIYDPCTVKLSETAGLVKAMGDEFSRALRETLKTNRP